jgi:hypothetical protein
MAHQEFDSDIRSGIYDILNRVGDSLIRDPDYTRPLYLFKEKLDFFTKDTKDLDLQYLKSFFTLYIDDLFFQILDPEVLILIEPEDLQPMIRDLGKYFKSLSKALSEKDSKKIYEAYLPFGELWNKIPNLGKRDEKELHPIYETKVEETNLPSAAKEFNRYPATKQIR